MSGQKRAFPYYSTVPEIDIKRRVIEGQNPGLASRSAEVFELPELEDLDPRDTVRKQVATLSTTIS
jgi:hypothetical protein